MSIWEIKVVPKYSELNLYFRYIDNGLGIWTPFSQYNLTEDYHWYNRFQHDFNTPFSIGHEFLKQIKTSRHSNGNSAPDQSPQSSSIWTSSWNTIPSLLPFMRNLRILTCTHYSPSSCHSPGVTKSLIYGAVTRAYHTCNHPNDWAPFLIKTLHWLQQQGPSENKTIFEIK